MARTGAETANPVTGERFVWRHTASSTAGEFLEFDLYLRAGVVVALPHVHPLQREDFRVERGAVELRIGKRREYVEAGGERSVATGTPHAWSQTGDDEAHLVVRLTPALHSEDYFENFCGLARDGKAAKSGLPRNPLQLAVLIHEHRHEFALPSAALRMIVAPLLAALASIGRRVGLRSRYAIYSTDEPSPSTYSSPSIRPPWWRFG